MITLLMKQRAWWKLNYAVDTGKILKPDKCSECYEPKQGHLLHGHHEDYSKPLDVKWLCTRCHGLLRRRVKVKQDKPTRDRVTYSGVLLPKLEESPFVNGGLLRRNDIVDDHEYWPEKIDWESHLECLTYRQREVIKLRFGIDDDYTYTLEEIAKIFKTTRQGVAYIEKKALDRLRKQFAA